MDERNPPDAGRQRNGRALTAIAAVLVAVSLALPLLLVVSSSRRLQPVSLPPSLRVPPPDTGLVAFRAGMRRKVLNLAARCASRRKQFAGRMTSAQDSLGRECDSAIAGVRKRLAALDTVARTGRRAAAESVRVAYEHAKLKVRVFSRSGPPDTMISEDSLDAEVRKLISE